MNLVVVKLNARAFDPVKKLVKERQVVLDEVAVAHVHGMLEELS
ncbi:hypothetical protein ACWGQL_37305 [Streptomyces lydicus]